MGKIIRIALAVWTAAFILFAPVAWAQPVPTAPTPVVAAAKVAAPAPVAAVAPVAAPAPPVTAFAPVALPDVAGFEQEVPAPPKPPQTPPPPKAPKPAETLGLFRPNVRIDVTLSDQTGSAAPTKKTISATVMEGGRGQVRSGVSAPILSTTYTPSAEGAKSAPMQSYSYRDMGLSLDATVVDVVDNRVRLRLSVEYNPVDEKTVGADGLPMAPMPQGAISFARFSQSLEIMLTSGEPLVVAASSDPVPSRNRTASLEVKATILK